MKSPVKRISALLGTVIILLALAASQLVGLIIHLPAGLLVGFIGIVIAQQLNMNRSNWANYLPYLGAFAGALVVGIVVGLMGNWKVVLLTTGYAIIIPLGTVLFYYGLDGQMPTLQD